MESLYQQMLNWAAVKGLGKQPKRPWNMPEYQPSFRLQLR